MFVKVEIGVSSLREELWGEAEKTLDYLTDDEIQEILDALDFEASDQMEIPTIDDLQNFFWHETQAVADYLGYDSFDEIMERNRHNAE